MTEFEVLESIPEIDTPPLVPTDDVAGEPLLEVKTGGIWVATSEEIFRAWTGQRRINGDEHHGPVYSLGTEIMYTGARVCACKDCQSTVESKHKKN